MEITNSLLRGVSWIKGSTPLLNMLKESDRVSCIKNMCPVWKDLTHLLTYFVEVEHIFETRVSRSRSIVALISHVIYTNDKEKKHFSFFSLFIYITDFPSFLLLYFYIFSCKKEIIVVFSSPVRLSVDRHTLAKLCVCIRVFLDKYCKSKEQFSKRKAV